MHGLMAVWRLESLLPLSSNLLLSSLLFLAFILEGLSSYIYILFLRASQNSRGEGIIFSSFFGAGFTFIVLSSSLGDTTRNTFHDIPAEAGFFSNLVILFLAAINQDEISPLKVHHHEVSNSRSLYGSYNFLWLSDGRRPYCGPCFKRYVEENDSYLRCCTTLMLLNHQCR
jgi:hypothetical protein